MHKHFLASAALIALATPAHAQEWTVGDQGVNWNVLSDKASVTGAAPADAYEPGEVDLPLDVDIDDWLVDSGDQLQLWDIGDPVNTAYLVGIDAEAKAAREKKIRINCEPALPPKRQDNILGFGIEVFGHPHLGTGSIDWDENSDFTSLRTNPASSCSGGPLNATNYMEPPMLKQLETGAVVAVLPQDQAFYYIDGEQDEASENTWLRRGMQFIIGGNPGNYNDTARRATYLAAGFLYPGSPDTPAGFQGYYCNLDDGSTVTVSLTTSRMKGDSGVALTTYARHLKDENGDDPWGGNCTGTEEEPATITANLGAPHCWDRYNLTAPDGRGHFWYRTRKGDNSVTEACPTTTAGDDYAQVPTAEIKNIYYTTGFADYGEWYLASDRMRMSTAECPDETAPCDGTGLNTIVSKDPCRATGLDFCNGSTLHADYSFGWFSEVFDQMQRECLGMTVRGVAPTDGPAECNGSQVDRYSYLNYGASPDTDYTGGCAQILACYDSVPGNDLERYALIPGESAGDVTVEHTGH